MTISRILFVIVVGGAHGCTQSNQPPAIPSQTSAARPANSVLDEPPSAESSPRVSQAGAARAPRQPNTSADAHDALAVDRWLATWAKVARTGRPVRVRIPVAVRGDDWACRCPRYFVGPSSASNPGTANWIELSGMSEQLKRAKPGVYLVTGRITGKSHTEDHRGKKGPEEWLYALLELEIDSARRIEDDSYPLNLETLGER